MSTLPTMRTRADEERENVERWKNGGDRDRLLILLGAFGVSRGPNLPSTDDADKIVADAEREFRQADYSNAIDAVRSLGLIVDHYKELAEDFHQKLVNYGTVLDEHGWVQHDPFVMLGEDGSQVLGAVEVLQVDCDTRDALWNYYVKNYLPIASEREREWIADNFADQINQEQA